MLTLERAAWAEGFLRIAGIDEVGRGPLAGPVVAAAVVLTDIENIVEFDKLTDSKLLSSSVREHLAAILRTCLPDGGWAVAAVDSQDIDRLNVLRASHLAMRRALSKLHPPPDYSLIDGLPVPDWRGACRTVVKGDRRSASIAAASILAKVYRDSQMIAYDRQYPGYGFAENKGYGTAAHLDALNKLGPCPLHRRSFSPVRNLLPGQLRQGELDFTEKADDF